MISRAAVADLCYAFGGAQGKDQIMDQTFGNWRNTAVGLGLTVVVVGLGLAVAFW
jgi:hypothetical protein